MANLTSVHLVGGQLAPKTFSDAEREVIGKALSKGGKPPSDAGPSVDFACAHCSDMKAKEKAAVAAAMLGDITVKAPAPAKKKTKTKTKKKG